MNYSIQMKNLIAREVAARKICAELNNFTDLQPTISTALRWIGELSGCEAVGVRLEKDGDYPYFVSEGFPGHFIKKENSLCAKNCEGERISDPDGRGYLLECMCGNIIRGRFDPTLPFFTEHGSFWSNHTSELLASTAPDDRQGNTRNFCNSCGYESVALIPIIARGERIGLLQLNDKRKDMFNRALISFMEMLGEQIGLAVQNSMAHTKLKQAVEEIRTLRRIIPICAWCKSIRDDEGYWQSVEQYLASNSLVELTHGMCPNCEEELYKNSSLDLEDDREDLAIGS